MLSCFLFQSNNIGNKSHKVNEAKSEAGSRNNTTSNHESDNVSSSLNYADGSDNGSGTQVTIPYIFFYCYV